MTILTGILNPFIPSLFSGVNNYEIFSFYDSKLIDFYGFNEEEIKNIL